MQPGDDAKIAEYQYDGRNYRVVKLVAAPKSVAPAAWHRTDLYVPTAKKGFGIENARHATR